MLHCLGSFTTGSGVDHPDLWHCFERLDRIHNGAAHKELVENNRLITYYLPVCYLLRTQQYPVNTTYNNIKT